ncbi:MAG: hypothetical protein IPH04_10560 [Saprospirales bacterium]|nr:hypothetical protein [Saprospirales bacterium]
MRTPIISKKSRIFLLTTGLTILAVCSFFVLRSNGPEPKKGISLFNYFSVHSVEAITLRLDLDAVYDKDSADFPGILNWVEKDGRQINMPVEISVRGKNRREVCTFPPLKLSTFENKELGAKKGHFKLVTHCTEDKGETLLLREYLTYLLYAELTDASFRTRLIHVTYEDRDGGEETVQSIAILLEPKKDLLKRLKAEDAVVDGPVKAISGEDYNRFAVFQFMIGNTDWNLDNQHNVRLLTPKEGGLPYPVPYDFDRSGLVNAPYASPHSMLPIETVRDRFFQWRGKDRKQLEPVLELFKQRKDRLMQLCQEFYMLPMEDRQDIISFLEEFYGNIDMLLTEGKRMAHSSEKVTVGAG